MSGTDFQFVPDPNSPNKGPQVNAACWSLFAFCSIFLGLRIYCKFQRHRGLWWDDHVLIASWVSFLIALIQLSVNIHYGFGKPGTQIDPQYSYKVGFGGLITGMFIMIAPALSKTSFILTISRLSGKKLKMFLWFVAVSMNCFQAAAMIVQWTLCDPVEKIWNPFMEGGDCLPQDINLGMSMGSAAYSGIIDLVLASIPWVILKDLQMKRREKIGIAAAMSLGVVAAVTAFMKCVKLKLLASSDFTLEGGELIIWASTEISTTIVAASIPVLRTLIKDLSTRGASGPSGGYFRSTGGDETGSRIKNNIRTPTASGRDRSTVIHSSRITTDEASDKSILVGGTIMKTEEIIIDFHDRGGPGFEMQRMPEAPQRAKF